MAELVEVMVERVAMAAESVFAADIEVSTGLDALDAAIGGLRSGDLILLTGGPGSGKSSLVSNLIRHVVLDAGCPALLASLQTKGEHLLPRITSNATGIAVRSLAAGKLTSLEWHLFDDVTRRLCKAPLIVCDSSVQSTHTLDADVVNGIERYGRCALVAIDHSELLGTAPNTGSRSSPALREICCELKLMARRRDCAVLLVESTNLCGSLVDMIPEADVILELRRTGRCSRDGRDERCEIRVLKQQIGPPCTVLVQFSAACGRFSTLQF